VSPAKTVAIRRATLDDVPALAAVMTDAFLRTPDSVWLIPDTATRRRIFARFVPRLLTFAILGGRVDTTSDCDAAAVWWNTTHLDVGGYQAIIAETCHPYIDAFTRLGQVLAMVEPTVPHETLAYLGVAPLRQQQGIGTALLRHGHHRLDHTGTPAYLVASTARSRDLYLRHGYQPTTDAPAHLPGGPPLWPMHRPPQATTPAPRRARP